MSIVLSKSLYQIHSCDKGLIFHLCEVHGDIRISIYIFPENINQLFKDMEIFIGQYSEIMYGSGNEGWSLKEGEHISYSTEDCHSNIGNRMMNRVIYDSNTKKIKL